MLVEINLLTEKRKKDVTYYLIVAIIISILLIGVASLKFVHDSVQNDIEQIDAERQTVTEQIATLQQMLDEQPISHYEYLKELVERTETSVIPSSELLRELVYLLPEYGYFNNFDFNHPDTVSFQVYFDQISSVAAYHFALNESPLISSVSLYSVNTETIELVEERENDFLPRYVANFELVVDRSAFSVKEED
ncbi:hypothetical protein BKP35_14345 [Anaerobacillus arseniciselenatis]|uniref:Fimbrial assembly protein n=1 Tax=Anaerobacillus arseniciselenatis TaxID=85682 RepID=A0A1S2LD69_9BACI|nr:hypothetical protein [Anaerobacillus arseniciselenatis]OIJ10274.1 hypothetical protein BKP35_14345 [Anaerobacillus arseniciselenatis]